MTIAYRLLPDGGFVCGDTQTGLTSYAYQTSTHAERARRHPKLVAREMCGAEDAICRVLPSVRGADARHWQILAQK